MNKKVTELYTCNTLDILVTHPMYIECLYAVKSVPSDSTWKCE